MKLASTHFLNSETYTLNKVHEFKTVVNVGRTDNYHLSLSRISRIALNMLRRWLKSGVETPPPDQYLSEQCQTPEKASEYAAANFEVLETITTSARKQKRGEYNHYSPDQQYKMAKYAVENRVSKAAKHFSKHLGKTLTKVAFVQSLKKQPRTIFQKDSNVINAVKQ